MLLQHPNSDAQSPHLSASGGGIPSPRESLTLSPLGLGNQGAQSEGSYIGTLGADFP